MAERAKPDDIGSSARWAKSKMSRTPIATFKIPLAKKISTRIIAIRGFIFLDHYIIVSFYRLNNISAISVFVSVIFVISIIGFVYSIVFFGDKRIFDDRACTTVFWINIQCLKYTDIVEVQKIINNGSSLRALDEQILFMHKDIEGKEKWKTIYKNIIIFSDVEKYNDLKNKITSIANNYNIPMKVIDRRPPPKGMGFDAYKNRILVDQL